MSEYTLALAGLAVVFVVLALVAIRFPQGRGDWPMDGRSTAYLLFSLLTLVVLFVAVYLLTQGIVWPPINWTLTVFAGLGLALLVLLALFLPRGLPRE